LVQYYLIGCFVDVNSKKKDKRDKKDKKEKKDKSKDKGADKPSRKPRSPNASAEFEPIVEDDDGLPMQVDARASGLSAPVVGKQKKSWFKSSAPSLCQYTWP
jgi:hypothetical protein